MKKQPAHCILLKVLWVLSALFSLFACSMVLIVAIGFYEPNSMLPAFIMMFGVLTSIFCIVGFKKAFEPELTQMKLEKDLYIQDQTKHMQEDFASTDADIKHRSIKKRTRSVKQGLSIENCPNCGDKIDADENFCSKCGKAIYTKCSKCQTVNQVGDKFCRSCGNKLKEQ